MADEEGRGSGGDAQESQVAIGTGEISLTENLNDTRHIDILIKQSNGPRPQATGVGAAPEDTAALNGRLKITVVIEKDTDKDILKDMRGWLMTVGTLFVTMAFQAALQPPAWMRTVDFLWYNQQATDPSVDFLGVSHAAATAPAMFAPSPGPSPQAAESTTGLSTRAWLYMGFNAFTFATALWLVLILLLDIKPARAKYTTKGATYMMVGMGISVMATFALGSSAQWFYTYMISIAMGAYAIFVVWFFKILPAKFCPAPSPAHAP